MRRLLVGLLMLFVLGSVLWLGAARTAQHLLTRMARDTASPFAAQDITTGGYPTTLSLGIVAPEWHDPRGWIWRAPQAGLQLALLSPTRLRLLLPPRQEFIANTHSQVLLSQNLRAEARFAADTALNLREFLTGAQALALPGLLATDRLHLRLTQGDRSGRVGFSLAVDGLRADDALPVPLPARLSQSPATLSANGALILSQPLDRLSLRQPPQLTGLALDQSELSWADSLIRASGTLRTDEQGRAAGRIVVKICGWRALLPLLVDLGAIRADALPAVEKAASRLAQPDPEAGPDGRLDLPLVFGSGRVSLGPFPLGPAPRLN